MAEFPGFKSRILAEKRFYEEPNTTYVRDQAGYYSMLRQSLTFGLIFVENDSPLAGLWVQFQEFQERFQRALRLVADAAEDLMEIDWHKDVELGFVSKPSDSQSNEAE